MCILTANIFDQTKHIASFVFASERERKHKHTHTHTHSTQIYESESAEIVYASRSLLRRNCSTVLEG